MYGYSCSRLRDASNIKNGLFTYEERQKTVNAIYKTFISPKSVVRYAALKTVSKRFNNLRVIWLNSDVMFSLFS